METAISSDDEGEFYRIMASTQDDFRAAAIRVQKDFFDASEGSQVGITANGDIALVMVMSQSGVKMMLEAWDAFMDHKCDAGEDTIMGLAYATWVLMQQIEPHLDEDVRNLKFFPPHGPQEG